MLKMRMQDSGGGELLLIGLNDGEQARLDSEGGIVFRFAEMGLDCDVVVFRAATDADLQEELRKRGIIPETVPAVRAGETVWIQGAPAGATRGPKN